MLSTKSRLSKTLLALFLALILTVSMLPLVNYSASAATYFAVTGTVSNAGMSTIVIATPAGKHRTFGKEDAQIVNPFGGGIALGDVVKITYTHDNPSMAVRITMVQPSSRQGRVEHDPNVRAVLMGIVRDIASDYITVTSGSRRYDFAIDDANVFGAPDGILIGDKVRITYYTNDPDDAVQVLMITQGRGHDQYGWDDSSYTAANRTFQGWVQDMGDHSMVIQNLESGMTMTFYYDDRSNDFPELAISDVVKVLYNDNNPGSALRVLMVDRGSNH